MKLAKRWWEIPSKHRVAIVAVAFVVILAVPILAIAPIGSIHVSTREYEVVSVFYNHVSGFNTVPGDNDFYQVIWAGEDSQLNARSFNAMDGSVHIWSSNFVKVQTIDKVSLIGVLFISETYELYLTNETVANARGGS